MNKPHEILDSRFLAIPQTEIKLECGGGGDDPPPPLLEEKPIPVEDPKIVEAKIEDLISKILAIPQTEIKLECGGGGDDPPPPRPEPESTSKAVARYLSGIKSNKTQ